jgi:hypothetical protein
MTGTLNVPPLTDHLNNSIAKRRPAPGRWCERHNLGVFSAAAAGIRTIDLQAHPTGQGYRSPRRMISFDDFDLSLSYTSLVRMAGLSKPPKWNSDLISSWPTLGRF